MKRSVLWLSFLLLATPLYAQHPDHKDVVDRARNAEVAAGNTFQSTCDAGKIQVRVILELKSAGEQVSRFKKNGGENICDGANISRIVYSDLAYYKILSDAGAFGANGAQWSYEGQANADQYDPNDLVGTVPPGPVVVPPPAFDVAAAFGNITLQLSDLQKVVNESRAKLDDLATHEDINQAKKEITATGRSLWQQLLPYILGGGLGALGGLVR